MRCDQNNINIGLEKGVLLGRSMGGDMEIVK